MNYEINKNIVTITNDDSSINFVFYHNEIVRIFTSKNDTSLIELNFPKASILYEVKEIQGGILISYSKYNFFVNEEMHLGVYKGEKLLTEVSFNKLFDEYENRDYYETIFTLGEDNNVYGLGDKMSYLDKKGYYFANYNTDDPSHQDELFPSLYKSINYILFRNSSNYFGTYFPSTYRYTYDVAKTTQDKVKVNNFDSNHDFFLFLGKDPMSITSKYSDLCGHPYFVRMKMLGYSQSRWSYENEEMVMNVYNNFKKHDLPLDYIHLDIHYMDGYRDFTIDKTRFNDMKALSETLKKGKVEIVAINDAAIKLDKEFDIYKFCEEHDLFGKLNNETYINTVWPGESAYPAYFKKECKEYFGNYAHKFLHEFGISGIWNDMNEPASFNGPLPNDVSFNTDVGYKNHDELHNIYGEHMCRSFIDTFHKDNLRPYLFTRAASATTSKYAFVWNGDNFSLWHHLRYSIPQVLSLGISNFGFNGVDIGGFGGDGNKQLLLRWLEADLLLPFLRNHSSLNTLHQEPYAFDEETIKIYKKFLDVRYALIPYLYDLTRDMSETGVPFARPLFLNYPNDKICHEINDEYMVGDSILVAPILDKDSNHRQVYLPRGKWINYFTGKEYQGSKFYVMDAQLNESLYFVKNNSIVPHFENLKYIEKEEIDTLVLRLYGSKGKYEHYEDDGKSLDYEKGIYNLYDIEFEHNTLRLKTKYKKFNTTYKTLKIVRGNKIIELPFEYELEVKLGE